MLTEYVKVCEKLNEQLGDEGKEDSCEPIENTSQREQLAWFIFDYTDEYNVCIGNLFHMRNKSFAPQQTDQGCKYLPNTCKV